MWAISPRGIGKAVGARSIAGVEMLGEGEFAVDEWSSDLVLAEDGISLRAPSEDEEIIAAKAERIAQAWDIAERRIEGGSVAVETSAGTHLYGTDRTSRDNIQGVLLGIQFGVTPSPRPWTPKGEVSPISLSHADLIAVGAAMMGHVDTEVQTYLAHKFAISELTSLADVANYDVAS